MLNQAQKSYIAGFLDGDGSIYVRLKPNQSYRYGFQISPYIVLFQSQKDQINFQKICNLINLGYLRVRKDGILEYIIGKTDAIRKFLQIVKPFVILKKEQVNLMIKILDIKENIKNKNDFIKLAKLIDDFRELNYSKKRKKRILTP
ncbi:MAG: Homing endonuclease [Parcubacteria group bacterium GW2011_GWB1_43_8b]|uniref:LAGLIDADG homing endonuclease n=1 Tax=Candidatus Wolfebacteria bacterium GW2011_GWC1_37_10 TaxID=1619010 RepID=A0A0G0G658_9BACT|nr:MAG: LAGLIDADG homing endonuclease [Candidatus Wolfebacteria bacterium GW2011_GWC1_37_10]KKT22530.1 MAG: Homing endonuclease [Parcubacteria group bacterium GW2011_GWB1_43_8b]